MLSHTLLLHSACLTFTSDVAMLLQQVLTLLMATMCSYHHLPTYSDIQLAGQRSPTDKCLLQKQSHVM